MESLYLRYFGTSSYSMFGLFELFGLFGVFELFGVRTGRCRYGLDIFFPISKCRTAGRHAGVDLTGLGSIFVVDFSILIQNFAMRLP